MRFDPAYPGRDLGDMVCRWAGWQVQGPKSTYHEDNPLSNLYRKRMVKDCEVVVIRENCMSTWKTRTLDFIFYFDYNNNMRLIGEEGGGEKEREGLDGLKG